MYMGTSGCVPQRQLVGKLASPPHQKVIRQHQNEHQGSSGATVMRNPEVSQSSRQSCRSGKVMPPENRSWGLKGTSVFAVSLVRRAGFPLCGVCGTQLSLPNRTAMGNEAS